ncbi:hypothetical protein [Rhizobium sp. PP-CC-3G-465]|uniref:hypothetical protein n=1 Tax=Rhizobium sp. PP-CC-3G-465 TaxID=2135648 RepID=UPI0010486933|nr:hypothetical protein C8J33_1011986 [Rhizobium sp. PP-CC-3G-465]
MVSLGWDYVRAEVAELCARLIAEGADPVEVRTILSTASLKMLVQEVGRDHAATVLRCIANTIEWDDEDHRGSETEERPRLTVIDGGGASKV